MFSNLPGRVTPARGNVVCEFEQYSYFETMKEMIDAAKASEALKLQYAKGEEYRCESLSTVRIQGETDSFGAEYCHLCDDCHTLDKEIQDYMEEKTGEEEGHCEWCKKATLRKHLAFTRDIDEGNHGPVYEVCGECRSRQNDQINEELDYLDSLND